MRKRREKFKIEIEFFSYAKSKIAFFAVSVWFFWKKKIVCTFSQNKQDYLKTKKNDGFNGTAAAAESVAETGAKAIHIPEYLGKLIEEEKNLENSLCVFHSPILWIIMIWSKESRQFRLTDFILCFFEE